jgi:membrane associated rhomboid family serine protease
MTMFGLQQVVPLREWLMLRRTDGLATAILHSLTCMLVHGNLLHAAGNALSFVCLFYGVQRGMSVKAALPGLIAGWMGTFLFAYTLLPQNATLVGSSGMVFGILGCFTASEPFSRWRFCGVGSIPLLALAPAMVLLDASASAFFFSVSAWPVHTISFLLGFLTSMSALVQASAGVRRAESGVPVP